MATGWDFMTDNAQAVASYLCGNLMPKTAQVAINLGPHDYDFQTEIV